MRTLVAQRDFILEGATTFWLSAVPICSTKCLFCQFLLKYYVIIKELYEIKLLNEPLS